VSILQGIFFVT